MKIHSIDGKTVEADTPEEIIHKLHITARNTYSTDERFIREYARRARFFTDQPIRTTDSLIFIRDLCRAGFLKMIHDVPNKTV